MIKIVQEIISLGPVAVAELVLVRRRNPKMSNGIVSLTLGVFLLLVGGCGQKGGIARLHLRA